MHHFIIDYSLLNMLAAHTRNGAYSVNYFSRLKGETNVYCVAHSRLNHKRSTKSGYGTDITPGQYLLCISS